MGTTAEKLTYLNETKTQLKDMLNLGGASLTTEPFRQYVDTLKNRYLYFMNNGTQQVWDNWDKVTGEGTIITLDNTEEAPMKIVLKGNTLQNGTPTPEAPQDIHVVSGDNTINVESKNLLDEKGLLNSTFTTGVYKYTNANFKGNRTLYFKAQLKSGKTALSGLYVALANYGSNPNSGTSAFSIRNGAVQNSGISNDFTGIDNLYISYYPTSYTWEEIINTYDLWVSTSDTTYSEYQGQQSYPVNLGVENLWKNQLNGFIPITGSYPTTNSTYPNSRYIAVKLLKGQSLTLSGSTDNYGRCRYIDIDTNQSVGTIISSGVNDYYTSTGDFSNGFVEGTITAKKDFIVGIMDLRSTANSLVVNYGSKQTISDNPIELCKIGDYQDRFIRNSGKNLFDEEYELGTINYDTGALESSTTIIRTKNYQTIKPSTKYTLKVPNEVTGIILYYYNNGSYIGGTQPQISSTTHTITFTTNANANQVKWRFNSNYTTLNNQTMFNEGTETLDYEPYGNGDWYLNKQIGKVVLDGSENWADWTITGIVPENITGYLLDNYIDYNSTSGQDIRGVCNYFQVYANAYVYAQSLGLRQTGDNLKRFYLAIDKNIASNIAGLKTWLSTHNTIVYYVLATPTYTEITDSTLISQLNALSGAKSYNSQTNISQENNDLASILNATALREME